MWYILYTYYTYYIHIIHMCEEFEKWCADRASMGGVSGVLAWWRGWRSSVCSVGGVDGVLTWVAWCCYCYYYYYWNTTLKKKCWVLTFTKMKNLSNRSEQWFKKRTWFEEQVLFYITLNRSQSQCGQIYFDMYNFANMPEYAWNITRLNKLKRNVPKYTRVLNALTRIIIAK